MFWWSLINAGNLMMALVVTLGAFLRITWHKLLLAFVAAAFLRFEPAVRKEEIIFVIISFSAMMLSDYLPFRRYINILISLTLGLLVFNVIIFLL